MSKITYKLTNTFDKLEHDDRLTILFLSWRDIKHTKKGGAEVFTHGMLKLTNHENFRIIHFGPSVAGNPEVEELDKITYLRKGNEISVIYYAWLYYLANRKNIDFVVDQCNTHHFFTPLWVKQKKRIFFIHQFTREIWKININSRLISFLGTILETPLIALSKNDYAITVSNSTRQELLDIGFKENKVYILPEGIEFVHWDEEQFLPKEDKPTFIYVGRYAKYKGIDDVVNAFTLLKVRYPEAKLWIVGKRNEEYIKEVLVPIIEENNLSYGSENDKDVVFWGFVTEEKKLELMSRSHALIFPSQREGWGLIVTEAAAVGTPSIVYNSPGIIDAVDGGAAGYLCSKNNAYGIFEYMREVIENLEEYKSIRDKAYRFSKNFHWKHTAEAFESFMLKLDEKGCLNKLAKHRKCNEGSGTVGIILSTYNNGSIAKECLLSCLEQSYKDVVIVVADDGSTDDTVKIIEDIKEEHTNLHLLKLPHCERGIARKKAYEELIKFNINYIYIIDSDMILENDLILKCVRYFCENSIVGGLVIPEIPFSNANNFYSKVKVFERSTINNAGEHLSANSIEAARFWRIDEYDSTGGINPEQISFEETQPTIRYLEMGGVIRRAVFTGVQHDEKRVTLKELISKKKYYFSKMDNTFRTESKGFFKALSRWYFFRPVLYRKENIKQYFRHPILFIGMMWMYLCLSFIGLKEILLKVLVKNK